ncbi:MAG: hypothetical protein Q4C54_04840 [Clostridia bacterium]|nr:hypothetical protein [Clostridia bacterium]
MNILMISRVLYPRSATETAMFCAAEAFRKLGHHVAWFSMEDKHNLPLEDVYVLIPKSRGRLARGFNRLVPSVYDKEAGECMQERLQADCPDLALVWSIPDTMTWSVVETLHNWAVPTWVMLMDYLPVCPGRRLLVDDRPCRACFEGDFRPAMRHHCAGDMTAYAVREQRALREQGLYGLPTGFFAPSEYHAKMFDEAQFTVKPVRNSELPLDPGAFEEVPTARGDFILYVGALTESKGITALMQSLAKCATHVPLVVAGDSPDRGALIKKATAMELS